MLAYTIATALGCRDLSDPHANSAILPVQPAALVVPASSTIQSLPLDWLGMLNPEWSDPGGHNPPAALVNKLCDSEPVLSISPHPTHIHVGNIKQDTHILALKNKGDGYLSIPDDPSPHMDAALHYLGESVYSSAHSQLPPFPSGSFQLMSDDDSNDVFDFAANYGGGEGFEVDGSDAVVADDAADAVVSLVGSFASAAVSSSSDSTRLTVVPNKRGGGGAGSVGAGPVPKHHTKNKKPKYVNKTYADLYTIMFQLFVDEKGNVLSVTPKQFDQFRQQLGPAHEWWCLENKWEFMLERQLRMFHLLCQFVKSLSTLKYDDVEVKRFTGPYEDIDTKSLTLRRTALEIDGLGGVFRTKRCRADEIITNYPAIVMSLDELKLIPFENNTQVDIKADELKWLAAKAKMKEGIHLTRIGVPFGLGCMLNDYRYPIGYEKPTHQLNVNAQIVDNPTASPKQETDEGILQVSNSSIQIQAIADIKVDEECLVQYGKTRADFFAGGSEFIQSCHVCFHKEQSITNQLIKCMSPRCTRFYHQYCIPYLDPNRMLMFSGIEKRCVWKCPLHDADWAKHVTHIPLQKLGSFHLLRDNAFTQSVVTNRMSTEDSDALLRKRNQSLPSRSQLQKASNMLFWGLSSGYSVFERSKPKQPKFTDHYFDRNLIRPNDQSAMGLCLRAKRQILAETYIQIDYDFTTEVSENAPRPTSLLRHCNLGEVSSSDHFGLHIFQWLHMGACQTNDDNLSNAFIFSWQRTATCDGKAYFYPSDRMWGMREKTATDIKDDDRVDIHLPMVLLTTKTIEVGESIRLHVRNHMPVSHAAASSSVGDSTGAGSAAASGGSAAAPRHAASSSTDMGLCVPYHMQSGRVKYDQELEQHLRAMYAKHVAAPTPTIAALTTELVNAFDALHAWPFIFGVIAPWYTPSLQNSQQHKWHNAGTRAELFQTFKHAICHPPT